MKYSDEAVLWAEERLREAEKKVERCIEKYDDGFLEISRDGKWDIAPKLNEWTNGFWPGILWLMYIHSGNEKARALAERLEEILDEPLKAPEDLAHDVGFMWSLSAVADYKITGSDMSKRRGFRAAKSLASRYNPAGYFRSWNEYGDLDVPGWTIVDNMMNLPVLYWAAKEWNGRQAGLDIMAQHHTDMAIKFIQRPDGSVNHIVAFNPLTGEPAPIPEASQGKTNASSWTRGQAWFIYGLALGAKYTEREDYLAAAKRAAHYFIAALDETCVPPSDFRFGESEPGWDSSAGACAACGLLEIAELVPDDEKHMYRRWAEKLLKGLYENCATDDASDNILDHASTHFHGERNATMGLVYGDYFYMEALYRLTGGEIIFW